MHKIQKKEKEQTIRRMKRQKKILNPSRCFPLSMKCCGQGDAQNPQETSLYQSFNDISTYTIDGKRNSIS